MSSQLKKSSKATLRHILWPAKRICFSQISLFLISSVISNNIMLMKNQTVNQGFSSPKFSPMIPDLAKISVADHQRVLLSRSNPSLLQYVERNTGSHFTRSHVSLFWRFQPLGVKSKYEILLFESLYTIIIGEPRVGTV